MGDKNYKKVRLTLVRSPISCLPRQKKTVRSLGLRKLNKSKEHVLSPSIEGMIAQVRHLLRLETL